MSEAHRKEAFWREKDRADRFMLERDALRAQLRLQEAAHAGSYSCRQKLARAEAQMERLTSDEAVEAACSAVLDYTRTYPQDYSHRRLIKAAITAAVAAAKGEG